MDIEHLESWVSQPDVCRCCLSASGSKDLLAAYINDNGEKEIYSALLHTCFGISLSLSEWCEGRLVCDLCVGRLHDAETFRRQVIRAEEHFLTYINSKNKKKPEENRAESEDLDFLHAEIDPVDEDKTHTVTEFPTGIGKDVHIERDCEPVNHDYKPYAEENSVIIKVPQLKPTIVKQVSERKRIKLTCEAVLGHTTACPFRHHRSWFQCFFCTQSFMEISTLRHHTVENHSNLDEEIRKLKRYPRSLQIDISELQCRRCNLNLTSVDSMRLHLIDIHSLVIYKECIADYKVNSSPYSCHLCTKQFHVFRTLTTHLNEHYANFICDICGKSFLNSKRLKVHNRTHESGYFPCSECGKILKTKTAKVNHMEKHYKRVIKCQICLKPMKHYNDRIKHMSEEHNITHKFKCPICSREYNIKHYLATHIRQTHGHKNKKCTECGMAFITNHGLKKHMQKHAGVKAFVCDVCSKSYVRSYTLREHMRSHLTAP